jgi:hypothetical protein
MTATPKTRAAWRTKWRKSGQCLDCGASPPLATLRRCAKCSTRRHEYAKKNYKARREKKLCTRCGKVRTSKYQCKRCAQ